jgi:hypothetical protein
MHLPFGPKIFGLSPYALYIVIRSKAVSYKIFFGLSFIPYYESNKNAYIVNLHYSSAMEIEHIL